MKLYGKIPHLSGSRTGRADKHIGLAPAKRLLEQCGVAEQVLVQEKLDGSNVIVTRRNGALLALGRDGKPCADSINPLRVAFADWLSEQAARFRWLAESERLVLEWLAVAHGTRYALPHEPVVALDFFDALGKRLTHAAMLEVIAPAGLPVPHLLHQGLALPLETALSLLGEHGFHGALDSAEGLVYRLESKHQVLLLAKYVRHNKQAGLYLADHTGLEEVRNTWT